MRAATLAAFIALCFASPNAQAQRDPLAQAFRNPPSSAKPHTWWHWMDGNITKEGITADLEAMRKAGIGGAQMFHVSQGIPPGPVGYMTPQWRQMVTHAVKEAGRLGIELCIHNCAGWSSSGGPWITPEHAMQKLVWSTTKLQGPARFSDVLPVPEKRHVVRPVNYYKDVFVLAFRTVPERDVAPEDQILGKTGVSRQDGLQPDISPAFTGLVISKDSVIDLTGKMDTTGHLTWDVPDGNWTVLRIGHTPTGKDNHPAPPEGDGLEVDKLSREALKVHWDGMMAKIIQDIGPLAGKVLNNSLIDSYEVGSQNWTPKFREEFRKRRGYDLLPYMLAIAGYQVGSKEETERFLWDFRRTIADLFADNYFRYFGELCHQAGMQFSTEPYGNGGFDNLQAGGTADIPMGEFWVGGGTLETTKVASSVGHTYGRKFVGAESFTADQNRGRYLVEPYGVKALGDLVFTNGINRYIFHRYAHQPWMTLKPGMTMGPWGTHLERTITWWNEAAEWFKYITRCQYLLQEGKFVADALYYYGESAPVDLPYRPFLKPALPAGYDYDGCDTTVILQRATVKEGRIVLPDGMSYRILVLPDTVFMTPAVARKIRDLVQAGATVVGPKPLQSPSLTGYPACDEEVRRIGQEVWGDLDGKARTERPFGQGRVFWGKPLAEVFASLKNLPDFEFQANNKRGIGGTRMVYIHRRIGDAEVYFVSNQRYSPANVECTFRVSGRAPELWHADTGLMELAPAYREESGRTVVPLRLDPAESVFVVFRQPAPARHLASVNFTSATAELEPLIPARPRITIRKAHYGAEDGRGADVTEKVRAMVEEGTFEIPATNDAFGDPLFNVVKRLRVEYELNGKPMTQTVGENETMMLVEGGSPAAAVGFPPFEVMSSGVGVTLTPWQSGTYQVQTEGGQTRSVAVKDAGQSLELSGPWTLNFPPGWGAPPSVQLDKLISWPEHSDTGVKYFSGTAEYVKEFDVPANMLGSGRAVYLDLGRVKNFATVRLNGKELGVLWKAPFRVDVGKAIKPGRNRLEIKVTNLWPNRLIGDEQLPADVEWNGIQLKKWPDWLLEGKPRPSGRYTFVTWHWYTKNSPLIESGLLGPVTLRSAKQIKL